MVSIVRGRGRGDGNGGGCQDLIEQPFALSGAQFFAVVQAFGDGIRVEDDRGGNDGSGKRPSAGLVGASDRPGAVPSGSQFKAEIGRKDNIREKGRIGRSAM